MKVGLVLSGGGARGIAHIGAIKAFEEHGLKFNQVSAASAGSIVGAFYCHGYSPDEILKIIDDTSLYKIVRPALSRKGFLKIDNAINIFKEYIPDDSFESLKIPLHVATTNVNTGFSEYFSSGSLLRIVQASCSIPVVFDPVLIGKHYYVDGGILNNLPVEPLVPLCDKIVGVHSNSAGLREDIGNMKDLIERSLQLAINYNAYARRGKCDIFLDPFKLKEYGVFDFKKAHEIFQIGYDEANRVIDSLPDFKEQFLID
ncbi:MAG: patatin-like phospholipase family protein [bacterium]|nr:patatin-like phospholipase family protein [bacterium]